MRVFIDVLTIFIIVRLTNTEPNVERLRKANVNADDTIYSNSLFECVTVKSVNISAVFVYC